jgi:hypothetical protein
MARSLRSRYEHVAVDRNLELRPWRLASHRPPTSSALRPPGAWLSISPYPTLCPPMTPADYVREIALPTALEFKQSPHCRRLACLTCMAVFHIKDHLKHAGAASVETTMRATARDSFNVVRAICNGTKHAATDSTHPISFRAGDDFHRPAARAGELECGISRFATEGGREIGHDPKKRFDIYQACKATLIAFCSSFPNQLGGCDLTDL